MAIEIERKFLVKNHSFKKLAKGVLYQQGFLSINKERIVRIRLVGNLAWITIKGLSHGAMRKEFEYSIPVHDAKIILEEMCQKPIISKYRYEIKFEGSIWEVDEFMNENDGLVIAEIELQHEDDDFEKPDWIGNEVTGEEKYYNSNLINNPFKNW
ncbi:MAG: CYTH domain-containing protein [Bacteroidales bacterium]|nr:CYTH domain-containing protein [Bacteroidales bacterium]MCF8403478.1 CYTH domain-containing protein [Bacteroidales bacterium]